MISSSIVGAVLLSFLRVVLHEGAHGTPTPDPTTGGIGWPVLAGGLLAVGIIGGIAWHFVGDR